MITVLSLDKSVLSSKQLEIFEKVRLFLASSRKCAKEYISDKEIVLFILSSLRTQKNDFFASGLQTIETANEVISKENKALSQKRDELKRFLIDKKQSELAKKESLKTLFSQLNQLLNS